MLFLLFIYLWYFLAGPPDPPTNLTVLNTTKDSITIRWEEGSFDGNNQVQHFKVLRNGETQNCSLNRTLCMPSITEAKITGLKPFTTYSFSVCSINSIGENCTKNNFNGRTSEDGVLYFFPLRWKFQISIFC